MKMAQGPINYNPQLKTLINLLKSDAPEAAKVILTLQTGDEETIRHMLKNFGNPNDTDWFDVTAALPWTDWQIDTAYMELNAIRPPDDQALRFWAW
jgi:hypothetical protein